VPEVEIKLPKLSKTYIKSVKQMRREYAAAKSECLKLLETSREIGMADGDVLKKLADNLRICDKQLTVGATYWICSTQLRELLSEQTLETLKAMNDVTMQAIFWDERIPDEHGHLNLPDRFY
jgi:hypothetical protein